MVLFQVPIIGYNNGRISTSVSCPFFGRFKVKLLNYHYGCTEATPRVMRLDCPQFNKSQSSTTVSSGGSGASYGSQVFFNNLSHQACYWSHDDYVFEADLKGQLDFDIVDATQPPNGTPPAPPIFNQAYFSFDFTEII
jgi:hypothetical protein